MKNDNKLKVLLVFLSNNSIESIRTNGVYRVIKHLLPTMMSRYELDTLSNSIDPVSDNSKLVIKQGDRLNSTQELADYLATSSTEYDEIHIHQSQFSVPMMYLALSTTRAKIKVIHHLEPHALSYSFGMSRLNRDIESGRFSDDYLSRLRLMFVTINGSTPSAAVWKYAKQYPRVGSLMSNVVNPVVIEKDRASDITKNYDFIFVGRSEPSRNCNELLAPLIQSYKDHPNPPKFLIITGPSTSDHEYYTRFVESISDLDYVTIQGGCTHKELQTKLASSSYLIMSSSSNESFSLVTFEALLNNCQIINLAYDTLDRARLEIPELSNHVSPVVGKYRMLGRTKIKRARLLMDKVMDNPSDVFSLDNSDIISYINQNYSPDAVLDSYELGGLSVDCNKELIDNKALSGEQLDKLLYKSNDNTRTATIASPRHYKYPTDDPSNELERTPEEYRVKLVSKLGLQVLVHDYEKMKVFVKSTHNLMPQLRGVKMSIFFNGKDFEGSEGSKRIEELVSLIHPDIEVLYNKEGMSYNDVLKNYLVFTDSTGVKSLQLLRMRQVALDALKDKEYWYILEDDMKCQGYSYASPNLGLMLLRAVEYMEKNPRCAVVHGGTTQFKKLTTHHLAAYLRNAYTAKGLLVRNIHDGKLVKDDLIMNSGGGGDDMSIWADRLHYGYYCAVMPGIKLTHYWDKPDWDNPDPTKRNLTCHTQEIRRHPIYGFETNMDKLYGLNIYFGETSYAEEQAVVYEWVTSKTGITKYLDKMMDVGYINIH